MPERRRNVALAAVCCVLDLLVFSRVEVELAYLTIVVHAVIGYAFLAWRDRIPVTVFAAMCVHSVVATVATVDYRPVVGIVVALYTVTTLKSRRIGLIALALTFVPTGFGSVQEFSTAPPDRALRALMVAVTAWSLFNVGAWLVGRRVQANHRKVLLLEQQHQAAAREAVAAERNRLAQELHDIIAHCVSAMLLQAAGARRMLAIDPDRAASALANIEQCGMQATGELRRLLGVIRAGDPVQTEGRPVNQHGLGDLEPLLDQVAAAGVPVRLVTYGEQGRLDPSVDLSAYRIVQEALTNVAKYSGRGTGTTVELRWEDDVLHLTVTDDGCGQLDRSPTQLSTGHGLLGLRERAAAVGGQLYAGPLPGGGFRVTATLPAPRRRDAEQDGRSRLAHPDPGTHRGVTDAGLSEGFSESE
ncbi:MAG: sensor histidine kinase [Pseudonocardiales bacterium]